VKTAIRIVDSATLMTRLFAVCPAGISTTRHYNMAKESLPYGSSDWVRMDAWTYPYQFADRDYEYWHFQ
jgi:hypothetical protein